MRRFLSPARSIFKLVWAFTFIASQVLSPIQVSKAAPLASGWTTLMNENFEGTFPTGLWNVFDADTSADEVYWGVTDFKPHAGTYSAWAARSGADGRDPAASVYADNMLSWMIYGPVDLSTYTGAELSFSYWNQAESSYDFLYVAASIDNSDFYVEALSPDTWNAWVDYTFDLGNVPTLGSVVGEPQVWVAFLFTSDSNTAFQGSFVDDISLRGYEAPTTPPGAFNRSAPAEGSTIAAGPVTFTWEPSSDVEFYLFCLDTEDDDYCNDTWVDTGTLTETTQTAPLGLTTYYWQVQAVNVISTTEANGGGAWGSFTTQEAPSVNFNKTSPADGAIQVDPYDAQFVWDSLSGADGYQICVDYDPASGCDTLWVDVGAITSTVRSDLSHGTTYYWQVRAYDGTETYANDGAWWSFTTRVYSPGTFSKINPYHFALDQQHDLTLEWGESLYADSYWYCVSKASGDCPGGWIGAGNVYTATVTDLDPTTTYYWQVFARNASGDELADMGNWWTFTTLPDPPAPFTRTNPLDGEELPPDEIIFTWEASAGAEYYNLCLDTEDDDACNDVWRDAGTDTQWVATNLLTETVYYWQVRATNPNTATYANDGFWGTFTTTVFLAQDFSKNNPFDSSIDQPLDLTLDWDAAQGAESYEYCVDETADNACDDEAWIDVGDVLTTTVTGLSRETTYYWQVRAVNAGGSREADYGTWSAFVTIPNPPAAFGKSAPAAGAVGVGTYLTFTWGAAVGAASYAVCWDTENDNICNSEWMETSSLTSFSTFGLETSTVYYWQVRAENPGGETLADGGAWRSFTTRAPQDWVVTTTADSGTGSLRQISLEAGSGETITFAPSLAGQTILLGSPVEIRGSVTIDGSALNPHVIISGQDASRIFWLGSGVDARLFGLDLTGGSASDGGAIHNEGVLEIRECMVYENNADGYGGGIYNSGTLTVTSSTIFSNTVTGNTGASGASGSTGSAGGAGWTGQNGLGGGVYNSGRLVMENTTLQGNVAIGGRGGTGGNGGRGTTGFTGSHGMTGQSRSCPQFGVCYGGMGGNGGPGGPGGTGGPGGSGGTGGDGVGGALYNRGTITLTNLTVSLNSTQSGPAGSGGSGGAGGSGGSGGMGGMGGACFCINFPCSCFSGLPGFSGPTGPSGSAGYSGSTGSAGDAFAGGLFASTYGPPVTLQNTIVAGNSSLNDSQGSGLFTLQGPSLIAGTEGCVFTNTQGTLITTTEVLLGALGDNGGTVFTRALLSGSPAIDAGSSQYCPATDARGYPRPADGNQDGVSACDLGAYELYSNPSVTASQALDPNPSGAASVRFGVRFTQPVTGVDQADFSLAASGVTGAAVQSVSGSGAVYTVTVTTGTGEGTLRLDVIDNGTIFDITGNPLGGAGAGNGSFTSGEVYSFDRVPPDTQLDSHPQTLENVTTASFSFSGTGSPSRFECKLDGGAFATCTSPVNLTGLSEGAHTFQVRAVDAAGNVDATPETFNWTVDSLPPNTSITAHPAALTNTAAASFTFSGSGSPSAFECKLDTASYAACTSPVSYTSLPDGEHTFMVRALDTANNVDATPASFTWTVDTIAPETSITSHPPAETLETTASFSFTATGEPGGYECQLDGSAFAACTSPKVYTGLNDGVHVFAVRAADAAGNVDATPASYTWGVGDLPLDTNLTGFPEALTNVRSATFTFFGTGNPSRFECMLDSGSFATCTSPVSYTALAEGQHAFQVRAVDSAGTPDDTPEVYTWEIDLTPPDTALTAYPDQATNATSAALAFTGSGSPMRFECSLDGAAFVTCTSPMAYSDLAEGEHTFQARSIDGAGNIDATPAAYTWQVDLTAPTGSVSIENGAAEASQLVVQLNLSANDSASGVCSMQVRNAGGAWSGWTPYSTTLLWTLESGVGEKQVEVRFRDCAGNVSGEYSDTILLTRSVHLIYIAVVRREP